MIRRNKFLVMSALIAFAAHANAGPAAVTPALAACSKALIETLAKSDSLPTYTVKAPSAFVSDLVDPYAFTVYAKDSKTRALLAKASCKATPKGEIVAFRQIPIKS
ncbi:MAG TPA: hypothetical protein VM146_00420 [Steroidobacteraceae bacterium]|nr:hypothetical protein [Steroidobacteraceae bacterium]